MTDFLQVDVNDLHQHALHIDAISARLTAPIEAGREVTPAGWNFAYGIKLQFLALILHEVGLHATDAYTKRKQALATDAEKLHHTAGEYDGGEQARKMLLESATNRNSALDAAERHVHDLVDKDTKFDPGVYHVDRDEINRGDYSSYNPFTPGPGHNWYAGSGLLDDAYELKKSIQHGADHSLLVAAGMKVTVELDKFGLATDPIATFGSWVGGWVLEHVKPIRFMLDCFAGNPDMVKGVAKTWDRIAKDLDTLHVNYVTSVENDTASWRGQAADAYRNRAAAPNAESLATMVVLADAISTVVNAVGELVDAARSILRDILAAAIGEAVKALAKQVIRYAPPTEMLGEIARQTTLASRVVIDVIRVIDEIAPLLSAVLSLYTGVAKIAPHGDN